jgi:hypothetical protein
VILVGGGCSYCTAISQASLRFVTCGNRFSMNAEIPACRTPWYFAIAGIWLCALGLAGLLAALVLWLWTRQGRDEKTAPLG